MAQHSSHLSVSFDIVFDTGLVPVQSVSTCESAFVRLIRTPSQFTFVGLDMLVAMLPASVVNPPQPKTWNSWRHLLERRVAVEDDQTAGRRVDAALGTGLSFRTGVRPLSPLMERVHIDGTKLFVIRVVRVVGL